MLSASNRYFFKLAFFAFGTGVAGGAFVVGGAEAAGASGAPDGLTVSSDGHLFASAPGGLLVMDANGKRLGLIETGARVSNCAFGDDGMLYLTSHTFVARVRTKVRGVGTAP